MGTPKINAAVGATRGRLARIRARETLVRRGHWVALVALGLGLARPMLWPLGADDPVWMGVPRALGLAVGGMLLGWITLYWVSRRKPSGLSAVRELDARLGLREVVASGWALHGDEAEEALARDRADGALHELNLPKLLPLPRTRPRWRTLLLGTLALVLAMLGGSYDPALARILMSPPTVAELEGAANLEDAAAEIEGTETDAVEPEGPRETPSETPRRESLSERASEIARDLGRGDREGALQKLRSLRSDANARREERRQLDRAARRMAEHLDVSRRDPSSDPHSDPGTTRSNESSERADADESMRLLSRRMRDTQSAENTNAEERRRTLERLSRAADEARRSGSQHGERLAEALSRAADAMNRGAMEEAAQRMEEAAARSAQLQAERERMQAQAEALARLLERAGMLERDVQLAMMGREGQGEGQEMMGSGEQPGEGDDGRRGLAEGLAARLAAMGLAEQSGRPGTGRDGGGRGSTRPGRTRAGLDTHGDLHARSQVREGVRAVQVLEGLGRNGEAETQYSDVYPSYGAIAEDALASEDVPAARREAVRRYFEMIRPDSWAAEREEDATD